MAYYTNVAPRIRTLKYIIVHWNPVDAKRGSFNTVLWVYFAGVWLSNTSNANYGLVFAEPEMNYYAAQISSTVMDWSNRSIE